MKREYDVFISSASTDRDAARTLASQLQEKGVKVWLDEAQIKPGERLREQVDRALSNIENCIVILGDQTTPQRPEVSTEWQAIQERLWKDQDLRIVPVEIGEHHELPPFLRKLQAIKAGTTEDDLARVAEMVAMILREDSRATEASDDDELAQRTSRFEILYDEIAEDVDEVQSASEVLEADERVSDYDVEIG